MFLLPEVVFRNPKKPEKQKLKKLRQNLFLLEHHVKENNKANSMINSSTNDHKTFIFEK